jgi:hypothetical protein
VRSKPSLRLKRRASKVQRTCAAQQANNKSKHSQINGGSRGTRDEGANAFAVVATFTTYGSAALPLNCTEGVAQVAAAGAPAHANEALPVKPAPGVNCRLKAAVWPAVTVKEVDPGPAGEIAKAALTVAPRAMIWGELGASSTMAIDAVRAPTATGEIDMCNVHVLPAAYAAALQLFAKLKSAEFAPARATDVMCSWPVPEFVSVMF